MAGVKGRSGRPRLSAEEHRLRGTFRADRHGSDPVRPQRAPPSAPAPPLDETSSSAPAEIRPPIGLVRAERRYWAIFAPLLASAKALTPADVETLADYCRACVAVDERGRRVRTAFRKRVLDNQTVRLLDTQLRGWIERKTRLAGELGLTAIARTRVAWSGHGQRLDPVQKPQSKLAQLQEQATTLRRPVGVT
jgi:phage terminase small subunit